MAKSRSSRRSARISAPVVIVNDPEALAAERALDSERGESRPSALENATGVAIENDPAAPDTTEVADKLLDDPTDGAVAEFNTSDKPGNPEEAAEQAEALKRDAGEVKLPAEEPTGLTEQAERLATETPEGRLLASRFPSAEEAYAYASNMRLKNFSCPKQPDGQFAVLVRSAPKPAQTPAPIAAPAAPRIISRARTPRAKTSGPREGTRVMVMWKALTRPEGVTNPEVDALLAAFQPDNIQPCAIGSGAKMFAERWGYDWRKEADPDGYTRYFVFPFASKASAASESEPATESKVESEQPAIGPGADLSSAGLSESASSEV